MAHCVFCEIVAKKIPASVVFEDDDLIVFMDNFPINRGHVLIASKAHFPNIHETPEALLIKMMFLVFKIEKALWSSDLKCQGTNILHSHGDAAGQDVFHLHFHVLPRFKNDNFDIAYGKKAENRDELDSSAKLIAKALLP